MKNTFELFGRVIYWSGTLSLLTTGFWKMAQEQHNPAFLVLLCLVGLASFFIMSVDLKCKLESRHLVRND